MKVKANYISSKPIFKRQYGQILSSEPYIQENMHIKMLSGLIAVDESGMETDDELFVITTFSTKKITYTNQNTNEDIHIDDFEHVALLDDLSKAHDIVISNSCDLSEGGSELFVAVDGYQMGEHKLRYWYEYCFETKDYAPCSEPEGIANVGIITNETLPFDSSLETDKITSLGFFKI